MKQLKRSSSYLERVWHTITRTVHAEETIQPAQSQSTSQQDIEETAREKISSHAELYRSLVRALKRRRGFGILFLQCTRTKGQEIVAQLRTDLPEKQIGQLKLVEPIENLKNLIAARDDLDDLNILFVEGIEHSLSPYIHSEIGRNDYYKLEVLPPILNHLNLHRENFRNQFKHLCLVIIVPPFALKYFMYRAVDFFSWRSGIWTFSPDKKEEIVKEKITDQESEHSKYLEISTAKMTARYSERLALSGEKRSERVLELKALIKSRNQSKEQHFRLLVELAELQFAAQNLDSALSCCNEVIEYGDIAPLDVYKKAVEISSIVWEQTEELIATSNALLVVYPDHYEILFDKGVALSRLGWTEEAVAAYDAVLTIKPDHLKALYNKGIVLAELGRTEEAIEAYDKALAIKPDYPEALYNKGVDLKELERFEEAIATYDAALAVRPNYSKAFYQKGIALGKLGRIEEAILAYDAALDIKPDYPDALYNKGVDLTELGRVEEAILAYEAVLSIRPDYLEAYYNKACIYAASNKVDDAISCLQKAIELDSTNQYIELAKTDTDFDTIRDRPQFQTLLSQHEQAQPSNERSQNP